MPAGHAIPYEAFPDVNPIGAPPNDFENIHATPEEFGALKARAEEKLGSGIESVGTAGLEAATQRQTQVNEIHASDVNSWFADQVTDKFQSFNQLQGKAKLDALPQFKADIEQLRQDAMARAPSLQEQARLSASMRGLTDNYYRYATNSADEAVKTYAQKTATDNAASYGNQAAIAYLQGDWATFEKNLNNQDMEIRNFYDAQHYDPQTIETEVTKSRGKLLAQIINTQADSDPNAASLLYGRYKTSMDPGSRYAVENKLAPMLRQQGFEVAGAAILGRPPPRDVFAHGERTAGVPGGYTSTVIGLESSWGQPPDRPGSQYKGLAQGNAAWNQRYGVTDPYNPVQVSNALLQEAQDNKPVLANVLGRTPSGGELYLAHQQGLGGATALLEDPNRPAWQAVRHFYGSDQVAQQAIWGNMSASMRAQFPGGPTSVSAGAFAQLWSGRYERAGTTVDIIDKQQAYKRADEAYGDNPVMWRGVRSVIDREYNFQQVTSAQRRGELEATVPGMIADVRGGNIEKPLPPDLALLGPVAASRLSAEYDSAYREGQARRSMIYASPAEINDSRASLASGPGDDQFRHRDLAAFDHAVEERNRLIFGNPGAEEEGKRRGDPGLYASTYPGVAAFKDQSKKNPADANAFGKYANASLALQEHLGVPAQDRHILSRSESEAFVKQLATPGVDVKGLLNQVKAQAGGYYDQVYRDLVTQGKLGPSYQLVGALDDKNASVLSRWLQGLAPNEKGEQQTADKILGEQSGHPVATTIRTNVRSNPALIDLQHSWKESGFNPVQIEGLFGAVENLAYAKSLYEEATPGDAATQAVEAIAGKYTIWRGEGSARVPIENNATVRANAAQVLTHVSEDNLALPEDRELEGVHVGTTRADYVRMLKAAPYWVTAPDGNALWLKDSYVKGGAGKGRVVTDKSGHPISVPFNAPLTEGTSPVYGTDIGGSGQPGAAKMTP